MAMTQKLPSENVRSDDVNINKMNHDENGHGLDVNNIVGMLMTIIENEGDPTLARFGYEKVHKICDTSQGELFKAKIIKSTDRNAKAGPVGSYVAIKKIDRELHQRQIVRLSDEEDEKDSVHFIEKNICKESQILQHITNDNMFSGYYVSQFLDFFEDETHLYLITKYLNGMKLNVFIKIAHSYIKSGTLKLRDWQKSVKYILWQLTVTLRGLHDIYHCAHLDICLDNIMLQNVEFVTDETGSIVISSDIELKLCDFGVAEIFDINNPDAFECYKQGLQINHHQYQPPNQMIGGVYDARASDMWAAGMIFYECMVGKPLYKAEDMWFYEDNGYWALYHGQLKTYLKNNNLLDSFPTSGLELLCSLLEMDQFKRLSASKCLQHNYFRSYYKKYNEQITKKMKKDIQRLSEQEHKMTNFPYYSLTRHRDSDSSSDD